MLKCWLNNLHYQIKTTNQGGVRLLEEIHHPMICSRLGEKLCKCWRSQPQFHGFVFNREFFWPGGCVAWHRQTTIFFW